MRKWKEFYEKMYTIRATETAIMAGLGSGALKGTAHVCIGQEAVSVGVCSVLGRDDYVFSNHRGHGHMLAMGMPPRDLIYEIAGTDRGSCSGLGGSQHISEPSIGFMGSNGITGGSVPVAVGSALAKKLKGGGSISVVFFGDGASSQGVVWESINMASIWELPVVFVFENNMYGMSSPKVKFVSGSMEGRARGFGLNYFKADGMDVESVYFNAMRSRDLALSCGPVILQCDTYRYLGHSKSDRQVYRKKEEVRKWKEKDPIKKLRCLISEDKTSTIERDIDNKIKFVCEDLGFDY